VELAHALQPGLAALLIGRDAERRILGGETRRVRFAKNPPTVIMLAGLQGAGKTTLAGKLGRWLKILAPQYMDNLAAKAIREKK